MKLETIKTLGEEKFRHLTGGKQTNFNNMFFMSKKRLQYQDRFCRKDLLCLAESYPPEGREVKLLTVSSPSLFGPAVSANCNAFFLFPLNC